MYSSGEFGGTSRTSIPCRAGRFGGGGPLYFSLPAPETSPERNLRPTRRQGAKSKPHVGGAGCKREKACPRRGPPHALPIGNNSHCRPGAYHARVLRRGTGRTSDNSPH